MRLPPKFKQYVTLEHFNPWISMLHVCFFNKGYLLLLWIVNEFQMKLDIVKLLECRKANYIEHWRIKDVLDQILVMYRIPDLKKILKHLIDPTRAATGLEIDFQTLVTACAIASGKIGDIIYLDGEKGQKISSFSVIPDEFFENTESAWKGQIKTIHTEDLLSEVEKAAEALHLAVIEDFAPTFPRIKATKAPYGGPKGEISYAQDHEAVWFKGKRFTSDLLFGSSREELIEQLKHALYNNKGRRVGKEWFTTQKVENALRRYHEANAKAKTRVLKLLEDLNVKLLSDMNILAFSSTLIVVANALSSHVREAWSMRKWVCPRMVKYHDFEEEELWDVSHQMKIVGLLPYWFDIKGGAVRNPVDMQSLFLLTGPSGGGKSCLLRSICAAALLGICGLMVPAKSAVIPYFDSIMLCMRSYDTSADRQSSFQVEMSELRSIIARTTKRSLVLVDEICQGKETLKENCIEGSILETLDKIGCLGIVSTQLQGIFILSLNIKNTVFKSMGTKCIDGQTRPTWKITNGVYNESLAFETAKKEGSPNGVYDENLAFETAKKQGIPETIIKRAECLYQSIDVEKQ